MLLAIDTSTRHAGVALANDQRIVACHCWYSAVNHSQELMPAVSQLLQSHKIGARDLEAIAVALGPGGFSALRVGISAAKGLAMATRTPLIGVGSLELEAHRYLDCGLLVCAWLDAGRREVASALFGSDGHRLRDDLVAAPQEILDDITQTTIFCGEGTLPWITLIKKQLGLRAMVSALPNPTDRLWSLVAMARRRVAASEYDDLASLQPYYLRMPSIGGPKRRDWTPQQS